MPSTDDRKPGATAAGLPQDRKLPMAKTVPGLSRDPASPEACRARILYVDDQPALADLGRQMLERLGYQARACTSGAQALHLMRDQPRCYDLLISDMSMPEMTGLELAAACLRIRPELKVIICTGHDVSPERQVDVWQDIPIAGLMNKPVGLEELEAAVREVLKKTP